MLESPAWIGPESSAARFDSRFWGAFQAQA